MVPETLPAPRGSVEIPEELLDSDAVKVVRRLRRAGHQAYLVGGCVRDLLLGMRPKDFDVATSAHPNQVKETFRNCRLIGRRFRLAHVYFRGGKVIEVSTFRSNPLDALVDLKDLPKDLLIRHDNVFGTAEEDARRRDFTINGLFYDLDEGKVVDHVGGKSDLASRLVRTIGIPDVRLREDPVRILRAIRFASKCALDLEPDTLAAMKAHAQEIPRCAPPRVLEELLKLVRSGAARRCFELLREVGALRVLLPPVAEYLEQRGRAEALSHLRSLDALDAHVRVGEIPSDAVLLATLLAPLPRGANTNAPIPKAPPLPPRARGAAADAPTSPELASPELASPEGDAAADPAAGGELATDADELDDELRSIQADLSEDAPEDEGDDEEEGAEDGPDGGPAEVPDDAAAEASAVPEVEVAQAAAAASQPLPEAALRPESELHDERLGPGIPAFSFGSGDPSQSWSLPKGVVAPEIVLAEMVRTARLPRRIAERARLVLSLQPILSGERKRRGRPAAHYARMSIFPEALAVFELSVAGSGRGAEALARWQAVFAGQPVPELEVEEPRGHGDAPAPKGKRRRRRGGRGRKKGT